MPAKSFRDLFEIPQSEYFYAAISGETGHVTSWYAGHPCTYTRSEEQPFSRDSSLSFDISNNYIQASIDIAGTIQAVQSPLGLSAYKDDLRGVFVQKEMIGAGPWRVEILLDGSPLPPEREETRAGLLANLFPLTRFRCGGLACELLSFAPQTGDAAPGLAAVLQVLRLSNAGSSPVSGVVQSRELNDLALGAEVTAGPGWLDWPAAGAMPFRVLPGGETFLSLAWVLAASKGEVSQAEGRLRQKPAEAWLEETLAFHHTRLGGLQISDGYYADSLVRMEELCRQAGMRLPDGAFAGGTLGSNANPGPQGWWNRNVWMKDNFYAALAMALFDPKQCESAILFFKEWGVPSHAWGRGLCRYPNADPLVQSLSNSLSSLVLASAYYQTTANRAFFLENPDFLSFAKGLLARIEVSGLHPGVSLFPSMYVSDGDARGDFHTGSNVVAWYCFHGMARICREVYQDSAFAARCEAVSGAIHRDLQSHNQGEGPLGRQYFEGSFADGTFVPLHDGEESDVALMPFYGFCETDDPGLIRHSSLGVSPFNPLYNPNADGIAWFDGGFACDSTFPGFTSALAGAEDETALLSALEHVRQLTDLDGSIWWWPHKLGCKSRSDVARFPNKCCWAAGVYVLKMVHDILGIQVDAPARRIRLAPFIPWESFSWQNCRIGAVALDVSYQRAQTAVRASLTNRNPVAYEVQAELILPVGKAAAGFQINRELYSQDSVRFRMRYHRPAYSAVLRLAPGERLDFEVQYR